MTIIPNVRVISSPNYINFFRALGIDKVIKNDFANAQAQNLDRYQKILNIRLSSYFLEKKFVEREKGDDITQFDVIW